MPKQAPVARVRNRGQVSSTLERYAEMYRERYPERDVRYVYDPKHKPELSGVLGREADGYEIVTYAEVGVEDETKEDQPVRVGDLVLMSIPKETKDALRRERESYAKEQRESVQRSYYEEIEKAANENSNPNHTRPGSSPMGRATITEKEFSYDIEQRRE